MILFNILKFFRLWFIIMFFMILVIGLELRKLFVCLIIFMFMKILFFFKFAAKLSIWFLMINLILHFIVLITRRPDRFASLFKRFIFIKFWCGWLLWFVAELVLSRCFKFVSFEWFSYFLFLVNLFSFIFLIIHFIYIDNKQLLF